MITTDIFLKMGSKHIVCEDYIVKGSIPVPFVILSDGCSSSSNTDMGSRILCHLAKQYLRYRQDDLYAIDYHQMGTWIIHNAEMTARQLGLSAKCLDATLIVAIQLDDIIKIFMYGDGAIVHKSRERIDTVFVDFAPHNAPYYLSYQIDHESNEQYYKLKNELVIKSNDEDDTFAYDYPVVFSYKIDSFDSLFICSDGISSFLFENHAERRVLSPMNILPDFMAFKGIKGEFLKRRVRKALKNLSKNGINHYDDLSIGAFLSIKED